MGVDSVSEASEASHRVANPRCDPWEEERPLGTTGWRRLLFPAVFLVYLAQTADGVGTHSKGFEAGLGYLLIFVFCACYLTAIMVTWSGPAVDRRFWALYGAMLALCAAEVPIAHGDAFVMLVFVAVITIGGVPKRAVVFIPVFVVAATFVPALVPSWHSGIDASGGVSILLVSLAMYGFFGITRANAALREARVEVARLAAENERNRIARDLHDLLGHSLTTITVKAGLARRLSGRDPERAATEIAEVEELCRRSLAELRAAVNGYREVTLAGELATGRELLRAAAIEAHLPGATDNVAPEYQELFGWVLREGVTNVVRHSRATECTVTTTWTSIDIGDNGVGSDDGAGNGLVGLRERVEALGGVVRAAAHQPAGWQLLVEMPSPPAAAAAPAATQAAATQAAANQAAATGTAEAEAEAEVSTPARP